jgi:hypothetical protein
MFVAQPVHATADNRPLAAIRSLPTPLYDRAVALSTSGANALQALTAWEAQVKPTINSVLVPSVVVDN